MLSTKVAHVLAYERRFNNKSPKNHCFYHQRHPFSDPTTTTNHLPTPSVPDPSLLKNGTDFEPTQSTNYNSVETPPHHHLPSFFIDHYGGATSRSRRNDDIQKIVDMGLDQSYGMIIKAIVQ
ncbi:hypothetical protein LIER_35463 [Lithospermum erythrorhizon]|uniref:Uncharacterized protein n=1 Tax=Lithospermum erythrorhizon TaxID=34254 RepID=A0AAV3NS66_LITER